MGGSSTLTIDPLFMDIDTTYGADDLGAPFRDLISEGVVNVAGGGFEVTERGAGANMSVDVAAGKAWILGDETHPTLDQPCYRARTTATVNLTVTAADATNERIDRVVCEMDDNPFDSSGSEQGRLHIIDGTPAGSPSAPAEPDNAITLATISVPALDTSIQDAQITDLRSDASVPGELVLKDEAVTPAKVERWTTDAEAAEQSITSSSFASLPTTPVSVSVTVPTGYAVEVMWGADYIAVGTANGELRVKNTTDGYNIADYGLAFGPDSTWSVGALRPGNTGDQNTTWIHTPATFGSAITIEIEAKENSGDFRVDNVTLAVRLVRVSA